MLLVFPFLVLAQSHKLIDRPRDMDNETRLKVMQDELRLSRPFLPRLEDGTISNDFVLSKDKNFFKNVGGMERRPGYWAVEGAKDEAIEFYLVDGPANIREKPDGDIITSWPDNKPVLLLRSKNEWKLVGDQSSYAWTHNKNLRPIPKDKILVPNNYVPINQELSKTLNQKLKAMEEIKSKGLCPEELTLAEKDKVLMYILDNNTKALDPIRLSRLRLQAYENCPEGKKPLNEKILSEFPKLKKKCSCYVTYFFESSQLEDVEAADWNRFSKDKCVKLNHHIKCNHEAQEEGEGDNQIACPLDCF